MEVARDVFEGLLFKVAEGPELRSAIALRNEVYETDVGFAPRDDLDERAHHLVALDQVEGGVVASLRILGPELRPFEIEQYVDIEAWHRGTWHPALIGRFCVRPDRRPVRRSALLHIGMLKLTYLFSRREGITDLLMYTFPHLLKFYRGMFFQCVGQTFHHPGYRQEMHLMHLELDSFERRRRRNADSRIARVLSSEDPTSFRV